MANYSHLRMQGTDLSPLEVGPSAGSSVPMGPNHFRSISFFPAANNPSQLTKTRMKEFYSNYYIPRGVYHIYKSKEDDRIYRMPYILESFGGSPAGLSETAFKCGFRVPLLQILKNLFG